jgi:YgiT-type zinc finger domain-containing protein
MLTKVRSRFPSMVPLQNEAAGAVLRQIRPPVDMDETVPLGTTARLRPAPEILPMKCLRCQGPVQRGTAPVRVDRDGYKLSWEAVPAWVCTRCELSYFEPQEVETVRKALRAIRKLAEV